MKILMVKLSAIGDVIHTLPALNALRAHDPGAHITWLVEEAASDLVVGHRALDRVLISRRKAWVRGIMTGDAAGSLRETAVFLRHLRDTQYDMILDFHGLLKSSILVALARGKRKIGFGQGMEHMEKSHLFLNERIPAVSMEHHALKRQLMLLEALGIRCDTVVYHVPIGAADRKAAETLLKSQGIFPGAAYVAVNPGAKWKSKLWPPERFAACVDALMHRYSMRTVFTGSREDIPLVEAIRSRMSEQAASLAGKTSLKILGALFENAACVLSTDTGPMHLAGAVGAPVVALFGPTAPWRTGPFGGSHRVVRTRMECSPCFKRDCETTACMAGISVPEVIEAVIGLIADSRKDSEGKPEPGKRF